MSERLPTSGMAIMDARTEEILRQNRLNQAIENRASSAEIALYNDTAQMEIFGSGSRTFYDADGNITASPTSPVKGIVAEIRENRKFGRSDTERNTTADKYVQDTQDLTDNGFELCQAKMIMDLRNKDSDITAKLMTQYIKSGMGPVEAHDKAKNTCERADNARLALIKKGGAFTTADYDRLRKGEHLYDDDGNYLASATTAVTTTSPKTTPTPAVADHVRDAQLYSLDEALEEAWTGLEYAQLSSIRERSGFRAAKNPRGKRAASNVAPGLRVTAEAVETSRLDLEEVRYHNHDAMRLRLLTAGVDKDQINQILHQHDALFARDVALRQINERTKLAGFSKEGALGSARVKFYEWWAHQGGGGDRFFSRGRLKGTVKKAMVMGALGVPAGIIGALASPLAGGALGVAGAALAARGAVGIAKGLASSHIERNAATTVAEAEGRRRYQDAQRSINEHYVAAPAGRIAVGPSSVTESFNAGTKREVKRNKARVVKAVGMAALGTGLAAGLSVAGDHLFSTGTTHAIDSASKVPKSHASAPIEVPKKLPPKVIKLQPNESSSFVVNPGDGIIDEISKYASAHGQNLTPQQADLVYQKLVSLHSGGANLVHLNGSGPSEYLIGKSDWGLSHPGQGTWGPGVQEQLDEMLSLAKQAKSVS